MTDATAFIRENFEPLVTLLCSIVSSKENTDRVRSEAANAARELVRSMEGLCAAVQDQVQQMEMKTKKDGLELSPGGLKLW